MRWPLPKSLNGFLFLGLAILAGPLLFAIVNATMQLRGLTEASQRLVVDSVQTTRLSQDMFAEIATLERSVRLYQVLGDATVLAAARAQDAHLSGAIAQLRGRLHAGGPQAQFEALNAQRAPISQLLTAAPAPQSDVAKLNADFTGLEERVNAVAALSNLQIDSDLNSLQRRSDQARRRLLLDSALLVPLILLVVLMFTLRIGRPLRQIDRCIGELGRGNFAHPVVVDGPVDLQRLAHQLEWLRNRLLELTQERNRFLRHMSHELKTPLANIREGTELLMDGAVGELDTGQKEVTSILRENGIKLQRLIENLLSFSAWENNSSGLEITEFRLRPVVKQVLENQQLTLVSQRVRLDVQIDDITLRADRGKMRLVLENLLSNAIKYSPRGGVIYLRARTNGGELVLEVADSGDGIPMEERPRIFDAFYTGRAPSGHVGGTGIGLSVVLEFVNVHGGSVEIIDGEFPGAHFRIRMPLNAQMNLIEGGQANAA